MPLRQHRHHQIGCEDRQVHRAVEHRRWAPREGQGGDEQSEGEEDRSLRIKPERQRQVEIDRRYRDCGNGQPDRGEPGTEREVEAGLQPVGIGCTNTKGR